VGGNHAGFGYYSVTARQAVLLKLSPVFAKMKDGTATLSKGVQCRLAAYALAELASRPV